MSFHIKNALAFGFERIAVQQLKENARESIKLDILYYYLVLQTDTHIYTYVRRCIMVEVTDKHLEVCQHKMITISNRGSKACATLSDPAEQKLE